MCVSSVGFFEYREVISLSSIYQLAFVRGRGYVFCEIEALFFLYNIYCCTNKFHHK